jgi:hypothetical protein
MAKSLSRAPWFCNPQMTSHRNIAKFSTIDNVAVVGTMGMDYNLSNSLESSSRVPQLSSYMIQAVVNIFNVVLVSLVASHVLKLAIHYGNRNSFLALSRLPFLLLFLFWYYLISVFLDIKGITFWNL